MLPQINEIRGTDWFQSMVEQIGAIHVETVYTAQETLIKGKYEIGQLISLNRPPEMKVTELVQYLANDLKISERDLWYCAKFHDEFNELMKLPNVDGNKSLSWNKIKKLLTSPNPKTPCLHSHVIMIKVCEDCGAKIKDEE